MKLIWFFSPIILIAQDAAHINQIGPLPNMQSSSVQAKLNSISKDFTSDYGANCNAGQDLFQSHFNISGLTGNGTGLIYNSASPMLDKNGNSYPNGTKLYFTVSGVTGNTNGNGSFIGVVTNSTTLTASSKFNGTQYIAGTPQGNGAWTGGGTVNTASLAWTGADNTSLWIKAINDIYNAGGGTLHISGFCGFARSIITLNFVNIVADAPSSSALVALHGAVLDTYYTYINNSLQSYFYSNGPVIITNQGTGGYYYGVLQPSAGKSISRTEVRNIQFSPGDTQAFATAVCGECQETSGFVYSNFYDGYNVQVDFSSYFGAQNCLCIQHATFYKSVIDAGNPTVGVFFAYAGIREHVEDLTFQYINSEGDIGIEIVNNTILSAKHLHAEEVSYVAKVMSGSRLTTENSSNQNVDQVAFYMGYPSELQLIAISSSNFGNGNPGNLVQDYSLRNGAIISSYFIGNYDSFCGQSGGGTTACSGSTLQSTWGYNGTPDSAWVSAHPTLAQNWNINNNHVANPTEFSSNVEFNTEVHFGVNSGSPTNFYNRILGANDTHRSYMSVGDQSLTILNHGVAGFYPNDMTQFAGCGMSLLGNDYLNTMGAGTLGFGMFTDGGTSQACNTGTSAFSIRSDGSGNLIFAGSKGLSGGAYTDYNIFTLHAGTISPQLSGSITNGGFIQLGTSLPLSEYPTCSGTYKNSLAAISNSSTSTQGAQIFGTGSNDVIGKCNGSAWIVAF